MIAKYKAIFNRKNKLKIGGTAPIVIEAYLNRSRKYIPTNLCVKPTEWDEKTGIVSRKHPDYPKFNRIISLKINQLEAFEFEILQKKGKFELSDLDNFGETKTQQTEFYEFMKESIEKRTIDEGTKKYHRRALKYLHQYQYSVKNFCNLLKNNQLG